MSKVKVRAIQEFFHGATKTHHKRGDEFEVTEDQAKALQGYVYIVKEDAKPVKEEKPAEKVEVAETKEKVENAGPGKKEAKK